ncbi:hypothetical protein HPP92_002076 [Vanilla planifolia]|uniref:BZIP domain-containing protein n=1 Tax=Vanilla planifolia TaxID=51239 RepID=A0A835RZ80_VANPL|nr:hypothetical protein HPP92_002076 [Vanilla planifolia]
MRNRESAQLSRQRKKHYVEELEEKVRSLHSTIAELNSKVSFIMAENASLKQQLVGNGSTTTKPGVYAAPITPVHFPCFPYPGVAFRSQGSPVPLVPIPKLKTQPPGKGGKLKKFDSKKGERRTKKVASFSLLGLLFFMLIYGRIVPGADHIYEGSKDTGGLEKDRTEFWDDSRSRILRVSDRHSSSHTSEGVLDQSKCIGDTCYDRISNKSSHGEPIQLEEKRAFDDHLFSMNFSETLPAFLYVPRNGKHVKINGNLIINSVLASEKAVSQEKSGNPAVRSSGKEDAQTGLAVPGNLDSALALANSGKDLSRYSKSHAISAEHQRALGSESEDASKDTSLDVPLQKWFREGLAGPMFSSGACTEVFQFEISPAIESNGIIPTASMANATEATSRNTSDNLPSSSSHPAKNMNRRFLYPRAIPLTGTTLDNTEHLGKAPEGGNFSGNTSAHPMVVSILADPREVGNGEVDETILPKKSLPRIFVVVLVDSVKYRRKRMTKEQSSFLN